DGHPPKSRQGLAGTSIMKRSILIGLAVALPLSLGACAASNSGTLDAGERLSQRGDVIGAYGKAWSDGQKNVVQGQRTIEKSSRSLAEGERDLARARADIAKAERRISEAVAAKADAQKQIEDGNIQMSRAEADYAVTKAGPSAVTRDD